MTTATKPEEYPCHYGRDKRDIRCECGGQVCSSGTLHPLANFGIGFRGNEFVIDRTYSRKVIGYVGFCLKCQRQGNFILPGKRAA